MPPFCVRPGLVGVMSVIRRSPLRSQKNVPVREWNSFSVQPSSMHSRIAATKGSARWRPLSVGRDALSVLRDVVLRIDLVEETGHVGADGIPLTRAAFLRTFKRLALGLIGLKLRIAFRKIDGARSDRPTANPSSRAGYIARTAGPVLDNHRLLIGHKYAEASII
jgi:hypothetical protein